MHEYSCDSGRRDVVYLFSLMVCAIVAFMIIYGINFYFGGIDIVLDFCIFVLSFGPLTIWVFFTNCFSSVLLKISGVHNCSGTYEGELTTSYDEFGIKHPITLIIKHGFQKIEIRLITENTKSNSKTASLHQDGGRINIVYTYGNTGAVDKGLNVHIGTCILAIEDGVIEGQYYTHPDRKNYGRITAIIVK